MPIIISFYSFLYFGVLLFLFFNFVLVSCNQRVMYISFVFIYTCCLLVTDSQSLGCPVNEYPNSGTIYCHPSCLVTVLHGGLFKWPDCNMYPGDQPHDNPYITIVYLLNTSVTIYRFPNILVFAQMLIFCCQSSKCCIPLHMKVTKDNIIKGNNIFVLSILMFHCNTAPQGCLLYVKCLLYAVMPRPLKLSLYCTHCNTPPPPPFCHHGFKWNVENVRMRMWEK